MVQPLLLMSKLMKVGILLVLGLCAIPFLLATILSCVLTFVFFFLTLILLGITLSLMRVNYRIGE